MRPIGTLVTIAKDVKLQVEFQSNQVGSYRLLGYENRVMSAADFNNDKKDAGDVGAGLLGDGPVRSRSRRWLPKPGIGRRPMRYRKAVVPQDGALSRELLTVKLRYKLPEADASTLVEYPVANPANVATVADGRGDAALFSFQLQESGSQSGGGQFAGIIRRKASRGHRSSKLTTANRRLLFRGTAEQVSQRKEEFWRRAR